MRIGRIATDWGWNGKVCTHACRWNVIRWCVRTQAQCEWDGEDSYDDGDGESGMALWCHGALYNRIEWDLHCTTRHATADCAEA